MERQIPTKFITEIVGSPIQVTPEITKARLRIFYKGLNRNETYITDEFANTLLTSLPYTPVVGIYNDLTKEFGGHAQDRNVANIYGIVPEHPNFAWEMHVDKDGIAREYACCDVYLYTARYEAARHIVGKQHSMELNTDTIQGDWQVIDDYGTEAFVYTAGRFIGLSVLGDNKEPCFEGSAFFELVEKFGNFMAANTSNGGKDMALELHKPTGESSPIETEVDIEETTTPTETPDTESSAETTPSTEDNSATDSTESDDSSVSDSEAKKDDVPTDCEDKPKDEEDDESDDAPADDKPKDEEDEEPQDDKKDDKPADSEANEEDKKEEQPADAAMDGGGQEVPGPQSGTTTEHRETQYTDSEPDEKKDEEKPADSTMAGGGQANPSAGIATSTPKCETTVSDTASFEAKILDLQSKVATYETEANKYKKLYEDLKADYDVLVTERNKVLATKKQAKIDEYSSLISKETKEDFESRIDSYSSLDELEKDLLFAAKPSLFAKNDNYAPTSFDREEDGLAALIKKSIKH